MRTLMTAVLVAGFLPVMAVFAAGDAAGQKQDTAAPVPALKAQTECPVAGGKIDKTLFVDNGGKRIYVCCKECLPVVEKDFDKYAQKLAKDNVAVEIRQTTCPVMVGEKINRKLFVDADGKRIYVCCGSCVKAVKKDPAKYIKQIEAEGITLDEAPAALK